MIHTPRSRTLLSGCFVLFAAACADAEAGSTELTPESRFPLRLISTVGPLGTGWPQFGIRGMGFGGPALNAAPAPFSVSTNGDLVARLSLVPGGDRAAMVLASPACVPDVVGGGIDTDGDGVPDDVTKTYTAANCTVYDSATGDAYLGRGVYRLRDTNDDLYGFQLDVTALSIRTRDGSANSFQEVVYNIAESGRTTTTGGTYHIVLDGTSTSGDFSQWTGQKVHLDLTQGFVPVGAIVAGGPLPDGTMTFSGTADITTSDAGPPARMVFQLITTVPLVYDDGCSMFTSGAHEMRLNGSLTEGIHVVFAACAGHYEPLGAGTL